jgi:hypothetical protein
MNQELINELRRIDLRLQAISDEASQDHYLVSNLADTVRALADVVYKLAQCSPSQK